MRAEHDRRFGYALAASIGVHAIVLFAAFPPLRESLQETMMAPEPLVTHLVELPRPEARPEPGKPPPERREARQEKPKPPSVPAPAAEIAPPLESPPQAEPRDQARTEAPVAPQAPAPSRLVEAATAAQYRLQLIDAARRYKPPYPQLARENNWIGSVTLDIQLRADGQAELSMRRSSGYAVLDRQAMETFQQALRVVPVPPALQGRQVRLAPLVVVYNLKE